MVKLPNLDVGEPYWTKYTRIDAEHFLSRRGVDGTKSSDLLGIT